jgi:CheY-like chemotaxis protein
MNRCSAPLRRVLLVEDNQDNADLVLDLLGGDFEIDWLADPAQALRTLRDPAAALPDLLLLDISLPGMDGVTLLREIRRDSRAASVPAIALTAHAMKNHRSELLAAGFHDYLGKPITDEAQLRATIERWLPVSA